MPVFYKIQFFALYLFGISFFYGSATTKSWSWNKEPAEETAETQDSEDSILHKMHHELQQFLHMSNKNAPDNKIIELVVGPTHFLPQNFISFTTSNGKKYKVKTADDLARLLQSCHYTIPHTTFSGVTFNHNFIGLLKSVDRVLWRGIIRIIECHFDTLREPEIYELFSTLKPESLSLVDNVGLTSDVLNSGIRDHIFGSSLAIMEDPGQLHLNPDGLIRFLHEPENGQMAILTLDPNSIVGGASALEEKIVERFNTNITPVSFYLHFTEEVKLPLLSKSPLYDTMNNELLSQEELELGPVKRTIIKRQRKIRNDDDL